MLIKLIENEFIPYYDICNAKVFKMHHKMTQDLLSDP